MGIDQRDAVDHVPAARSRTTLRWIFPVAVFGSSSTTSTRRGRLYPAEAAAAVLRERLGVDRPLRDRHDAGNRLDEPVGASRADHHDLAHVRMLDQHGFDLSRRDPLTADLEHVVGAAQIRVEAVLRLDVHVAAAKPLALEARPRRVGTAPVPRRRRVTGDPELAGRPRRHVVPLLVRQSEAVAADDRAGRARAAPTGAVGRVDVRHLRRADPVEDLDAETLVEAREELGRQRLPRRQRQPHRGERVVRKLGGEQRPVERGHGEEQRRPLCTHDLSHPVRLRGEGRLEYRRCAHRQREAERVPEPVGVEQRRHGEAAVFRPDVDAPRARSPLR